MGSKGATITIDMSDFDRHLGHLSGAMKRAALKEIGLAGGEILKTAQQAKLLELPAYLTGATHDSVSSHDDELTDTRYVNEIGPETVYAPNIEYGRRDMPNYPVRPYVRPTTQMNEAQTLAAVSNKFRQTVEASWRG